MAENLETFVAERAWDKPSRGMQMIDKAIYIGNNVIFNYIISIGITDLFLGFNHFPDKKVNGVDVPSRNEKNPVSTLATIAQGTKAGPALAAAANKAFTGYLTLHDGFETASRFFFGAGKKDLTDPKNKGLNTAVTKTADTLTNIFTLSMGGHFSAVAVKLMEDKKVGWARQLDAYLDKKSGHVVSEQERDARELRYAVASITQKKSWGKIALARVAGVATLMSSNTIANWTDSKITGVGNGKLAKEEIGIRRISDAARTGILSVTKAEQNAPPGSQKQKAIHYWAEMAGFEAICTFITTQVMERFAKHHSKKENPHVAELVAAYKQKWSNSAPRDAQSVETQSSPQPQVKYSDRHASVASQPHRTSTRQPVSHSAMVETQAQAEGQMVR